MRGARLISTAVGVAVVAVACGPAKTLDTAQLRLDITDAVVQDFGVEALGVDCPDAVAVDKGASFDCTVALDGGDLTIEVTQSSDQGELSFRAAETVVLYEAATDRVARAYEKQKGKRVEVSCGEGAVFVGQPGDTFDCEVRDRAGQRAAITLTVKDKTGEVLFEVVSLKPSD